MLLEDQDDVVVPTKDQKSPLQSSWNTHLPDWLTNVWSKYLKMTLCFITANFHSISNQRITLMEKSRIKSKKRRLKSLTFTSFWQRQWSWIHPSKQAPSLYSISSTSQKDLIRRRRWENQGLDLSPFFTPYSCSLPARLVTTMFLM